MANEITNYLANYVAPASAVVALVVAYVAVYKNSQPQLIVYYQPSARQQSFIELVIENVGTGNAFDVKFSKPIPISWFGIESSSGVGSYVPTSGIPSLAPKQRLVFIGGQYSGLAQELEKSGGKVKISYNFNPPLWPSKGATDECVLSIEHLKGMPSVKSLEQAVVDAIVGTNRTTIRDIRDSLQAIEKRLGEFGPAKE